MESPDILFLGLPDNLQDHQTHNLQDRGQYMISPDNLWVWQTIYRIARQNMISVDNLQDRCTIYRINGQLTGSPDNLLGFNNPVQKQIFVNPKSHLLERAEPCLYTNVT